MLSHPQYPSISRFQDALQAGAGQEALIAEITVANVIQDQIPGKLGQAGPALLSMTISRVMILAGMLCIVGTAVSVYRATTSAQV